MTTPLRTRLRRQLYNYRTFVSHNDTTLFYRYQQFMEHCIVCNNPDYWTGKEAAARMYSHASVFRDTLYYDVYDTLLGHLEVTRNEYCLAHQVCYVRVTLWTDEFNIDFDAALLLSRPPPETLRKCARINEQNRKATYNVQHSH